VTRLILIHLHLLILKAWCALYRRTPHAITHEEREGSVKWIESKGSKERAREIKRGM
jgi:hypothetical protein